MVKRQQAAAQGKGFGLLFEMGCGKTLTAIAIAGAADFGLQCLAEGI